MVMPLSLCLVREIHARLMQGVRGDAGVVEKITGREWGKVYLAQAIRQAVSGS